MNSLEARVCTAAKPLAKHLEPCGRCKGNHLPPSSGEPVGVQGWLGASRAIGYALGRYVGLCAPPWHLCITTVWGGMLEEMHGYGGSAWVARPCYWRPTRGPKDVTGTRVCGAARLHIFCRGWPLC